MLLSRTLGRTLGELGRTMSLAEFLLWVREYNRDPWGEERADMRSGIVASTIANVNRGKHTSAFRVADFMPKFGDRAPRKMTPEDQEIFNRHMVLLHNKLMRGSQAKNGDHRNIGDRGDGLGQEGRSGPEVS